MEFPTSQLQASVALTMFSPDVVPALYGQLKNSEQRTYRNYRRDVGEGICESGSEQHQHNHKRSLKKLGQFFKRKPYGSLGKSSQATLQSSRHREQDFKHTRELEQPHLHFPKDSVDLEDTFVTSIKDASFEDISIPSIENDSEISHNECPSTSEAEKREDVSRKCSYFRTHQRAESFHVNLTPHDVQRIAKEIYDQTIAEVNLSLFSYWLNESEENYEEAKRHIRELRLDHGYNLARIANVHLRKLMQDVFNQRPVYAKPFTQLSLRRSPGIPNLREPGTDWCHKGLKTAGLATRTPSSLLSNPFIQVLDTDTHISIIRKLTDYCVSSEAYITLHKKISLNDIAMATSDTPTCSIFPRIDVLPPSLRIQRQRAVTQAALHSVPMDSLSSPQRNYPPNAPDCPPPLSVRSTSTNLHPPTPYKFEFPPSEPSPLLPLGFPSPRSPLRASDNSFGILIPYTSSLYNESGDEDEKTDKEYDQESLWESQVADIYERVVGLERPDQLDQVIEELQGLRALYYNNTISSARTEE